MLLQLILINEISSQVALRYLSYFSKVNFTKISQLFLMQPEQQRLLYYNEFSIKLNPFLAESLGFEPRERSSRSTVFKTGPLNHSGNSPQSTYAFAIKLSETCLLLVHGITAVFHGLSEDYRGMYIFSMFLMNTSHGGRLAIC